MFRLILDVKDVDYNTLIDLLSDMIKKNKDNPALKGMKIPTAGFGMLKHLPMDKKNEMFAMVINQDKNRTMQTLESVISSAVGYAKVLDASAMALADGIQLLVDIGTYDFDRGIDLLFPKYMRKEDFNEAMGEDTADILTVDEFAKEVKSLSINDKEVILLRSLRMKKEAVLFDLENVLRQKGISLHFGEFKILVRR